MENRMFKLPDGRILWVGAGIGNPPLFMTFDSDPAAGGRHRFVSPLLKPRKTRDQAQGDLELYARSKHLEEVAS
jgi:hypothetical protein